MNVTLYSSPGQAPLRRRWHNGFQSFVALAGILLAAGAARAGTVSDLEAVDANGVSTWSGSYPLTVVGVLLTDPDEMLDSTPDFVPWNSGAGMFQLGGEWQVFVQALAPGDRGGVECWMGQNYGNLPWIHDSNLSYTNEGWAVEVDRVSHDPATGHAFQRGDLVAVTANGSLFYGGQQNINEEHSIDPGMDFSIALVSPNFGLPAPEVISLASVVRPDDTNAATHEDIFDPARATGGERYQGMRVRINGLTLVTTNGWNPALDWSSRECTVTDGEGRYLTLIHPRYSLGAAPTNRFDATGVFLQESGSGTDGTFGYELFAQEIAPSADAELSIAMRAVITWPGSLSNFQLQSTDSLSNPNWTAVTNTPVLLDGRNAVILEPVSAQKHFRLERAQ